MHSPFSLFPRVFRVQFEFFGAFLALLGDSFGAGVRADCTIREAVAGDFPSLTSSLSLYLPSSLSLSFLNVSLSLSFCLHFVFSCFCVVYFVAVAVFRLCRFHCNLCTDLFFFIPPPPLLLYFSSSTFPLCLRRYLMLIVGSN